MGFNQFEIILTVFVSSFWFIWIPMLWGLRPLEICLLLQCVDREFLVSNWTDMSTFHPLEVVDRGSETQL